MKKLLSIVTILLVQLGLAQDIDAQPFNSWEAANRFMIRSTRYPQFAVENEKVGFVIVSVNILPPDSASWVIIESADECLTLEVNRVMKKASKQWGFVEMPTTVLILFHFDYSTKLSNQGALFPKKFPAAVKRESFDGKQIVVMHPISCPTTSYR